MNQNRLFVGNLSYQTADNDLQDYFSQAGAVTSVNVMFDKMTGKSRGSLLWSSPRLRANKASSSSTTRNFKAEL